MVRQFYVCLTTPRNFVCSPFSRVEGDIARGNFDCFRVYSNEQKDADGHQMEVVGMKVKEM
jgi:hypothetical protein